MRFKYGMKRRNDKESVISFLTNPKFGLSEGIKGIIDFIKYHNTAKTRVLVLIKGE